MALQLRVSIEDVPCESPEDHPGKPCTLAYVPPEWLGDDVSTEDRAIVDAIKAWVVAKVQRGMTDGAQ